MSWETQYCQDGNQVQIAYICKAVPVKIVTAFIACTNKICVKVEKVQNKKKGIAQQHCYKSN